MLVSARTDEWGNPERSVSSFEMNFRERMSSVREEGRGKHMEENTSLRDGICLLQKMRGDMAGE